MGTFIKQGHLDSVSPGHSASGRDWPLLHCEFLHMFFEEQDLIPMQIPKVNLPARILRLLRDLTYFTTSIQFALALRLSDLTQSTRVLGFLLPFRKGFDPSLLFVASSAVPFGILLYQFVYSLGTRSENTGGKNAVRAAEPRLGGNWVWKSARNGIDAKLIGGGLFFWIWMGTNRDLS